MCKSHALYPQLSGARFQLSRISHAHTARDLELLRQINGDWRSPLLDAVMPWLSEPLMLAAALPMILGHLYCKGYKLNSKRLLATLVFCAATAPAANLSTRAVKYLVERPRPLYFLGDIRHYDAAWGLWRKTPGNYLPDVTEPAVSFFSAHVSTNMALAAVLGLYFPPPRAWGGLVPALCGYSRIYGMHYPSDVLVGWAFGALTAWAPWQTRKRRALQKDVN